MPRRIMLSVFALAVVATGARAADLPTQSRLGAIFAEPSEVGTRVDRSRKRAAPIMPFNGLPNPPWNRGSYYYGSSWFLAAAACPMSAAFTAIAERLREKTDFFKRIKLFLAVQSHLQKYFSFRSPQITSRTFRIPSHTEGRFAIVTDVGHGMRWTR